ncbi:Asp/Glu/hydantoin racemase [Candidatus Bathyarchaeota archaeon]|nr:Asp/Glu/hydantoin racemase [Candidatus Bathyarchaeota archaeon]MBS7626909.1 Asp/Glu/hydantoin racemase [Candidatus Bathyarchaeota archaeon]
MSRILGMIHTVFSIVEPINRLVLEIMPGVDRINIVDDYIVKLIEARGGITPEISRIVASHILAVEGEGADAILVTCSSISPCVDYARPLVSVPVLKIDDPMTDMAVQMGDRIGVLATAPTTVKPTSELLLKKAGQMGKKITIEVELKEDALEALTVGDKESHDRILLDSITSLSGKVDVIVLAQASMAHLESKVDENTRQKVLTSPRSGVEQAKKILGL